MSAFNRTSLEMSPSRPTKTSKLVQVDSQQLLIQDVEELLNNIDSRYRHFTSHDFLVERERRTAEVYELIDALGRNDSEAELIKIRQKVRKAIDDAEDDIKKYVAAQLAEEEKPPQPTLPFAYPTFKSLRTRAAKSKPSWKPSQKDSKTEKFKGNLELNDEFFNKLSKKLGFKPSSQFLSKPYFGAHNHNFQDGPLLAKPQTPPIASNSLLSPEQLKVLGSPQEPPTAVLLCPPQRTPPCSIAAIPDQRGNLILSHEATQTNGFPSFPDTIEKITQTNAWVNPKKKSWTDEGVQTSLYLNTVHPSGSKEEEGGHQSKTRAETRNPQKKPPLEKLSHVSLASFSFPFDQETFIEEKRKKLRVEILPRIDINGKLQPPKEHVKLINIQESDSSPSEEQVNGHLDQDSSQRHPIAPNIVNAKNENFHDQPSALESGPSLPPFAQSKHKGKPEEPETKTEPLDRSTLLHLVSELVQESLSVHHISEHPLQPLSYPDNKPFPKSPIPSPELSPVEESPNVPLNHIMTLIPKHPSPPSPPLFSDTEQPSEGLYKRSPKATTKDEKLYYSPVPSPELTINPSPSSSPSSTPPPNTLLDGQDLEHRSLQLLDASTQVTDNSFRSHFQDKDTQVTPLSSLSSTLEISSEDRVSPGEILLPLANFSLGEIAPDTGKKRKSDKHHPSFGSPHTKLQVSQTSLSEGEILHSGEASPDIFVEGLHSTQEESSSDHGEESGEEMSHISPLRHTLSTSSTQYSLLSLSEGEAAVPIQR